MKVVGSRNDPMKLSIIRIHPPQEEDRRAYTPSRFAVGSLKTKTENDLPPQRRPPDGTGGSKSINLMLQLWYFRKYFSIS
jgi:hypothetical protein